MMRRSNPEPAQWRLPDGRQGIQLAAYGHQLALRVSRPNWPFPETVVVERSQCQRVVLDTLKEEEALW